MQLVHGLGAKGYVGFGMLILLAHYRLARGISAIDAVEARKAPLVARTGHAENVVVVSGDICAHIAAAAIIRLAFIDVDASALVVGELVPTVARAVETAIGVHAQLRAAVVAEALIDIFVAVDALPPLLAHTLVASRGVFAVANVLARVGHALVQQFAVLAVIAFRALACVPRRFVNARRTILARRSFALIDIVARELVRVEHKARPTSASVASVGFVNTTLRAVSLRARRHCRPHHARESWWAWGGSRPHYSSR